MPGVETQQQLQEQLPNVHNGVENAQKSGKLSVERIYQKKTQLEHILLRPDTYIGSVEPVTEPMWVYDSEVEQIVQKNVTYVPGLYKIFDEILVNAADNKQRDKNMDTIKIDIDQENNTITIYNNGNGIPVTVHKDEKMYVPTMIFGHLLTSSNYNDEEQKVTGGRNGYGAKLCNIFSTKFTVETACKSSKKQFKQIWGNNMSKTTEPKIKDFTGDDFTRITFSPDLVKFKMETLDNDIVSVMARRAYDVAASTRGVKVYLNGKKIPIKNFKDYVDLYLKDKTDDAGNPVKPVYENANERWEVAIAISDKGFQQMSFVNSIATTKGGRHVDYITDMVVKNLTESLKKKNKSGVSIKPFQIKNHLWVFVNCLIVNPTFDSQTKENMTLQAKSFGSKCAMSEKFIGQVSKCGIVECVMAWAKFKQQAQLQSKCTSKKQNKLKGVPKLEDANDAGTRYSSDCTLILTEGDSAKTLAVAGLGVVGRDRYGVFPLKGKILNVREATHKQILENAEINNIIKILGLQYKKKYDSLDDIKSLRYGKLMIMTDQDQDGSHIKGLLINFIHHNWPTLIRHNFLEEFITPIVKATKGKEEFNFYSLPEFEEWKQKKDNWHTYKIKYYKGLGTSTSKEAKEYFQDMVRHRILFNYAGAQDDHSITMAFSKKAVDQRKEWLTGWMEEGKRRKELGLPEIYLYEKNTKAVTYSDFVNKELVLFSNLDNERSIPSLVDGLKPGQRKVLYTCLKRNDKREVKVAQLAGSVAEHSAYHHGEQSLMSTIINLAQNFVGSNNINLLQPIGQFGTRLQGGKDAASPRYIFTMLSPLAKHIFNPYDEPLLKSNFDDNKKIEPEWYMPIIPMVLVNGAEGIGTGWSTKIPNYNPREIVRNITRMIHGDDPLPMKPWFKNFLGTIEELEQQRYIVHGEIGRLAHNQFEITELPVRVWTQVYKEAVLEPYLQGSEKVPALISDYKEYNTDLTVRFVVSVPENKVDKIDDEGPHKVFKLHGSLATSSMVLFDHNGCLRKFETVDEILKEFYDLRLKFYGKRREYLIGMLEAEARKLTNQARFIVEKCDGRLVVENKKKKDLLQELARKGYDPDPVKAWKKLQNRGVVESSSDDSEAEETQVQSDLDYDYLLSMAMWHLTLEKKEELLKKKDDKVTELKQLQAKSPTDLWEEDLVEFLKELDKVEEEERENAMVGTTAGATKKAPGKRKKIQEEVMPSPFAERIVPHIDPELRRKAEKAAIAKEKGRKGKKESPVEFDEFDDMVTTSGGKSLASRLGNSPELIAKKAKLQKKGDGMKQTKLPFKKLSPKKKKNEWDDSGESESISGDSDIVDVEPRSRAAGSRRAAAAKIKYNFSDDEEEGDSDMSFHSNDGIAEDDDKPDMASFLDESLPSEIAKKKPAPKPKVTQKTAPPKDEIEISDTDSEFGGISKKLPPPKQDKPTASDLFDNLVSTSSPEKDSPVATNAKAPAKDIARQMESSSDSDDLFNPEPIEDEPAPVKAKKPVPKRKAEEDNFGEPAQKKKPIRKRKMAAAAAATPDTDSDDYTSHKPAKGRPKQVAAPEPEVELRTKSSRARKAVSYANLADDSDEDSDF